MSKGMSPEGGGEFFTKLKQYWASVDHNLENVGEWGEMSGIYDVGDVSVDSFETEIHTKQLDSTLGDELFEKRRASVFYSRGGIGLTQYGENEAEEHGSALATLTPDQAREIALYLVVAAEELERWQAVTDD